VRWCIFFASIQDGAIQSDQTGSYAALGVECPTLTREALIVVSNEIDFRHLWELYEDRLVADDEEVLLVHVPADHEGIGRLVAKSLPCLDIMVYPKGHFKQAYDPGFWTLDWAAWREESARWEPSEPWAPPDSSTRMTAHLLYPRHR